MTNIQIEETVAPVVEQDAAPKTNGQSDALASVEEVPKKTFTLRRPLNINDGEPITELKFREPTTADIVRYGYPVVMRSAPGGIQLVTDESKMTAMMTALADVPPGAIDQMDSRDWATISAYLLAFFVPDWEQIR
jgi:hypothetical protein